MMMAMTLRALRFLDGRRQDVRFWLVQARNALLQRADRNSLHPARAHIHAPHNLGAWAADAVTAFAGSWLFVAIHVVWFTVWMVLRLDINLLTLIVSLEAIYLATFVLMSQNRSAARDRTRDDTEAREVDELTDINRRQLVILQQQDVILAAIQSAASGQPSGQPVVVKPQPASQEPQASQMPPHAPAQAQHGPLTRRQQAIKKP